MFILGLNTSIGHFGQGIAAVWGKVFYIISTSSASRYAQITVNVVGYISMFFALFLKKQIIATCWNHNTAIKTHQATEHSCILSEGNSATIYNNYLICGSALLDYENKKKSQ